MIELIFEFFFNLMKLFLNFFLRNNLFQILFYWIVLILIVDPFLSFFFYHSESIFLFFSQTVVESGIADQMRLTDLILHDVSL